MNTLVETKSNDSIISRKNKKRNNIKMAALYDNMISATYTLNNGELDKEKIENQKVSFVAINLYSGMGCPQRPEGS